MANAGARATWMSSTIWRKPWFKAWKRGGKLLWFYLTSCDEGTIAGIFQCDPDVAKMRTGPWGDAAWQRDTAAMYPHVIFYPDNWVFIPGYLEENTHGINEKHAAGIARVVNDAPEQIRADFMARYEKPLGVFAMGIDTPSIPPSNPSDETSPPLPSPTHPILTSSDTLSGAGKKKPRKFSDEEWGIGKAGAAYAIEAARKHTGSPDPSGYKFGQFLSVFCERAKSEAEYTVQDCQDCVDEWFKRLKDKEAKAAARGDERHYMGTFGGFKSGLDSIAAEVAARRGA